MNKGEVWALQQTKKPVGLRLSVLPLLLKQTTNKQNGVAKVRNYQWVHYNIDYNIYNAIFALIADCSISSTLYFRLYAYFNLQ